MLVATEKNANKEQSYQKQTSLGRNGHVDHHLEILQVFVQRGVEIMQCVDGGCKDLHRPAAQQECVIPLQIRTAPGCLGEPTLPELSGVVPDRTGHGAPRTRVCDTRYEESGSGALPRSASLAPR